MLASREFRVPVELADPDPGAGRRPADPNIAKAHSHRCEVDRTMLLLLLVVFRFGYELQSVRTVQIADKCGGLARVDVDHRELFQTADRSEQ